MVKKCKKCGEEKDIQSFYKHAGMTDGHLSFCKSCVKERVFRYGKTEAGKKTARKRNQKPERKKWKTEWQKKRRKKFPEKYKAMRIIQYHIQRGSLKKLKCMRCSENKNIEAHHPDYDFPLEITWLCRKCHRKLHFNQLENFNLKPIDYSYLARRNEISFQGKSFTKKQWSEKLKISEEAIRSRLRRGWSIEKAFLTPVKNRRSFLINLINLNMKLDPKNKKTWFSQVRCYVYEKDQVDHYCKEKDTTWATLVRKMLRKQKIVKDD